MRIVSVNKTKYFRLKGWTLYNEDLGVDEYTSDQFHAIGLFTPTETILCLFKPNNTQQRLVSEVICSGDAWFESRQGHWHQVVKCVRKIAKSYY
jgi:hypothetical protein